MRMLILTTAAIALSGTAHAEQTRSFTHDGVTYEYVVTERGSNQVIVGTRDDGTAFRLVVRGERVRGTMGRQQVSFSLDEVRPLVSRPTTALAAR